MTMPGQTSARELRIVATEQPIGHVVRHPDGTVEFREQAGDVLGRFRRQLGDDKAAALLLENGWSNGYLYLTPLQPIEAEALTAAGREFHLPGEHDQKAHGKGNGVSDLMSPEEFDARIGSAARLSDVKDMTEIHPRDPGTRQAINDYGAEGYIFTNGGLRKAAGDVGKVDDPRALEIIPGMDDAFKGSGLDRDAVVVRGVIEPEVTFGGQEIQVGMTWIDHGFVSTSAKFHASSMFTGVDYEVEGGVEMRILAPRGTPAISSDLLVYDSEVVLGRGLSYRVVRDNGVDEDGVRQIDVEVIR